MELVQEDLDYYFNDKIILYNTEKPEDLKEQLNIIYKKLRII